MRTGEVEIGRWRVVAAASWELSRLIALMRGRRGLTWPQGRDHVFQEPPTGPGALHQFNTCCSLVVPLCSLVQNFNDISTGNRGPPFRQFWSTQTHLQQIDHIAFVPSPSGHGWVQGMKVFIFLFFLLSFPNEGWDFTKENN